MKRALITGLTGQDGTYLSELLLTKGYELIGIVRSSRSDQEVFLQDMNKSIEVVDWDMLDQKRIVEILSYYRPEEFYNLAAYSSGKDMFDDAINMGEINGIGVTRILDAIRSVDSKIRFCQASSSEMFGETLDSPQSEKSQFIPRSPYGVAKLYAHSMIRIYRNKYNLFACSAILFNHESPRRGLGFVTRKISHEVAKIKLGLATELSIGNLEARRDWGFAGDYVLAMWKMLQCPEANDYVIASGKTHSVRELCEIAFSHVGLDYKQFLCEDVTSYRPTENFQLVGDATKARNELAWAPKVGLRELIAMMVDADLQLLQASNDINN